MFKFIKVFAVEEDGAVTVDWVVLTALVVGMGLFVLGVISVAVQQLAVTVATDLTTAGS